MLRTSSPSRATLWPAQLAVLGLTFWLRLIDLRSLPVFVDEGTHLLWAQQFAAGQNSYPWLMDGRILLGILLAQFPALSANPLWTARTFIAVLSLISGAACLAMGTSLGSRAAGLLAGVLYAVLPFTVFHDRQAIADPLTGAFGALALAVALRMARQGWKRWGFALALGLALAAAILTKLTSATYLAIPVLAVIVLPRNAVERRRALAHNLIVLGCMALLFGAFGLAFANRLGQSEGILTTQRLSFVECPPIVCRLDLAEQLRRLPAVLAGLREMIAPYLGWPLIGLALLAGFVRAAWPRRVIWFLYLSTLASLVAVILAATRPLPPRYFTFASVPLAVTAALGLRWAAGALSRRMRVAPLAPGAALTLLTLIPVLNTVPLIASPARAALPAFDQYQYFTGPYAGAGFAEAAQAIRLDSANQRALVLVDSFVFHSLSAYLDPARFTAADAPTADWATAIDALRAGRIVYVVDRLTGVDPLSAPGSDRGLLLTYPRPEPGAWLRLRRVADASPESLIQIFNALFIRPDAFIDSYDQFVAGLDRVRPVLLVPYPSHQVEFLRERAAALPNAQIMDAGGAQPWDTASTMTTLDGLRSVTNPIKIIFLQETRLDPHQTVETWLNSHLYRLTEVWYGPLRVVDFAGEAPVRQSLSANVRFGDFITLRSVEIVDSPVAAGGTLRLRLNWEAAGPTARPYKFFAHLFNAQGILAQHDGQPVGELRPTTTWAAGEALTDLVGLPVPADAQPGEYHLRLGWYDLETQARLPAQLDDGSPAEFYEGGTIIVLPR